MEKKRNDKPAAEKREKDALPVQQAEKALFAYLRVSSREQSWDRQLNQIKGLAVPEEHIYCEKASGKDFDWQEYQKLRKRLQAGDVLIITGLDRLGRNYEEMREEWRYLTKQKKVEIWVLNMPLLNSGWKQDLISAFVAELVLEILSFVSEQERQNIRERQAAGIASAKNRGVAFGRPRKKRSFAEHFAAYQAGEASCEEICRRLGIGKTTFYRRRKEWLAGELPAEKAVEEKPLHRHSSKRQQENKEINKENKENKGKKRIQMKDCKQRTKHK